MKRRRGKLLLKLLAVAAVGAGVALALNEDLRASVLGSSSESEQDNGGGFS